MIIKLKHILTIFKLIIFSPVKASKSKKFSNYDMKIMKYILYIVLILQSMWFILIEKGRYELLSNIIGIVISYFMFYLLTNLFIRLEHYIISRICSITIPLDIYVKIILPYYIVGFIISLILNFTNEFILINIITSLIFQMWMLYHRYLIIKNRIGLEHLYRKKVIVILVTIIMFFCFQIWVLFL